MYKVEPPLRSYGELSRQCLGHPDWPEDVQPKPRSLAALFSKFDRLIELEWLSDRAQVQLALSGVLNCPLGAVQATLEKSLRGSDEALARWRLADAPLARPIELLEEPLPPGFPAVVTRPVLWKAVWWQANVGDGANLVRHWLDARGLARTVVARTWSDAQEQLVAGEPTFVELEVAESDIFIPGGLAVCVACPGAPPASFQLVKSPSLVEYIDELLSWLADRLPRDGQFDLSEAATCFEAAVDGGLVNDLETAVGFAGLLDEIGVAKVRGRPLHRLAEDFVEQRLTRAGFCGHAEAQWLKQRGFAVLVGMARRALTESALPWDRARSQDEWINLVPVEFQRGVDAEWASLSLARAGAKLSVGELQRALAGTPPGAFRVIRALMSTRLLEASTDSLFRLGPRWLVQSVRVRAEHMLLSESPFEWGEALLREHASARISELLFARVESGESQLLDQVLELDDEDNPAFILALETLVLAVGRACLRGVEFESEQLASLLETQWGYAVCLDEDPPMPRVLCNRTARDSYGGWLLALWAISEQCDEFEKAYPALMNPWASLPDAGVMRVALDHVQIYLEGASANSDELWVRNAYSLLARLARTELTENQNGPCGTGAQTLGNAWLEHPLILPFRLSSRSSLAQWRSVALSPASLRAAAQLREDWPLLAAGAFRIWTKSGETQLGFLALESPLASIFWPHVPSEFLSRLASVDPALLARIPSVYIGEKSWPVLLTHLYPARDTTDLNGAAIPCGKVHSLSNDLCQSLPLAQLSRALDGAAQYGDSNALTQLWARTPEQVLSEALSLVDHERWTSAALIFDCSPDRCRNALIMGLKERFEQLGIAHPVAGFARRWLHDVVCEKGACFSDAYALLAEIERRRNRALIAGKASVRQPTYAAGSEFKSN